MTEQPFKNLIICNSITNIEHLNNISINIGKSIKKGQDNQREAINIENESLEAQLSGPAYNRDRENEFDEFNESTQKRDNLKHDNFKSKGFKENSLPFKIATLNVRGLNQEID